MILWSDTKLLSIMQMPELAGSQKYWFDNTEITDVVFEAALNKAKNSWAKNKYVPDICRWFYT